MHQSRLARSAERAKLLEPASFPNKQPRPKQQQVSLAQVIPILLQQGAKPSCRIGGNTDEKVVILVAELAGLAIPLSWTAEETQKVIEALEQSLAAISEAQPVESTDPARDAELLALSAQAVAGDEDLGYVLSAEACTDA